MGGGIEIEGHCDAGEITTKTGSRGNVGIRDCLRGEVDELNKGKLTQEESK